jgi:hypothetical protein
MKKVLREPLLHFLLLGVAIFAAWRWTSVPTDDEPSRISITQGEIESIAVGFGRTWRRPPTREELDALIRERVRDEVYYREAVALGMDRDDLIIRRRLRQKMEFVTDDLAAHAEPTDEDLSAYLAAHADAFRVERRFTFAHVYLNPETRRDDLAGDAAELLAQLTRDGAKVDTSALGDRFLLDYRFESLPAGEVAKLFGEPFAAKLGTIPPGVWHGPLESGYGAHLVFVSDRTEGRAPALAEVHDAVRREWANARRRETTEKLYEAMLKRYAVTIERPAEPPAAAASAAR